MAVNPLKVFLFLAGGGVAAGATAYVSGALDPYIYGQRRRRSPICPSRRLPNRPRPRASACRAPMPRPSRLPISPRLRPMAALTPPADGALSRRRADAAAAPPTDANPPATMAATATGRCGRAAARVRSPHRRPPGRRAELRRRARRGRRLGGRRRQGGARRAGRTAQRRAACWAAPRPAPKAISRSCSTSR